MLRTSGEQVAAGKCNVLREENGVWKGKVPVKEEGSLRRNDESWKERNSSSGGNECQV